MIITLPVHILLQYVHTIKNVCYQKHRSVIDKIVGFLKMNVSKNVRSIGDEKIWQRSYHDHIIRGKKDYQKI